ncbi:unnamed protein product [Owenia fusiformis]|uniref:Uncharacterized protein n=1 Tax=Owenia fusiformis TaxID=6347 RepID=A0A8J1UYH2_OWEFU|nr:unnamed protein product [Owenia fusiformis]
MEVWTWSKRSVRPDIVMLIVVTIIATITIEADGSKLRRKIGSVNGANSKFAIGFREFETDVPIGTGKQKRSKEQGDEDDAPNRMERQNDVVIPVGLGMKFKINENAGLAGGGKVPTIPTPPLTKPTTNKPTRPVPPFQGDTPFESCADVVLAVDLSCSVSSSSRERAKHLARLLASSIKIAPNRGIQLGLISFTNNARNHIRFNKDDSQGNILKMIEDLDFETTARSCRTRTWKALINADIMYFSDVSGVDRDDSIHGDVLVIIGDGLGSPKRQQKMTVKYAQKMKADNVEIIWVVTELAKSSHVSKETEIDLISTDADDLVLKMEDESTESIAIRLAEHLGRSYPCKT